MNQRIRHRYPHGRKERPGLIDFPAWDWTAVNFSLNSIGYFDHAPSLLPGSHFSV
jgi:hypothetical protein